MSERVHHHSEFPSERLTSERSLSTAICIPARDEADSIARTVDIACEARRLKVVDQIVVIDDRSTDGTGDIARRHGADVVESAGLMSPYGDVLGKGDAMWRVLSVVDADVIGFVDADSADFGLHFICGLLGPLMVDDGVDFVKGFYRRPFRAGEVTFQDGGGRVTELLARPLLRAFYPQLAGIRQPLAGEFAGRSELLERVPFEPGYGVEIGLLIDVVQQIGIERIAQVNLDQRLNSHQPLTALTPMADAVVDAVMRRLSAERRLVHDHESSVPLRPPHAEVFATHDDGLHS